MGGVGGRHALGRFADMSWMDELAISRGAEEGRVFSNKSFAVEDLRCWSSWRCRGRYQWMPSCAKTQSPCRSGDAHPERGGGEKVTGRWFWDDTGWTICVLPT